MDPVFRVHHQARRILGRQLEDLTPDEWVAIPPGGLNSILWQVGHVVVTQQLLTRGRAGLPLHVDDAALAAFRKDTSPADWTTTPDRAQVLGWLQDLPGRTEKEYRDGVFVEFEPYTSGSGFAMHTIEDAIAFNNFHEGMHAGLMLAMKRGLRSN